MILDGSDQVRTVNSSDIPESAATIDYVPIRVPPRSLDEEFLTNSDDSLSEYSTDMPTSSDVITDLGVRFAVPGYEILRELGRGGMGVVYQARHTGLNRLVALKMILSGAHAGPNERDRFRGEAQAVAQLQHPNIVQIFEVGEAENRPYLAFEYIEGGSLSSYLSGQPWSATHAAEFVEVLARAVQFAHDRGIVHRDLKPGNILISDLPFRGPKSKPDSQGGNSPTIKITDFGLAKRLEPDSDDPGEEVSNPSQEKRHTRTGAVMGTPSYIAPEQAAGRNKDVGPPADVYALSAILYELLTGRPPFRGETALDTVLQVMSDDPVPPRQLQPKIRRDLETICLKGLQKTPAKRYASAGDLADDLRRVLNHEPIAARPIGYWERGVKWAKRHPAAATMGATSILAVLTLLAISVYFNVQLQQAADDKEKEAKTAREEREKADLARADAQRQAIMASNNAKDAHDREIRALEAEKAATKAREDASRDLEKARRGEYALTLNQIMALGERDPQGASRLLNSKRCPEQYRDFTWNMLRRMYLVEEKSIEGHGGPIGSVSFSPDGHYLASASWDGTVRILDMRTFQPLAILRGHRHVVRSVAFAPDSRTLVTTGNDSTIRLWEIPPAKLDPVEPNAPLPLLRAWALLTVEKEAFRTAIFSGDGKHLIAGSEKGNLYIWDMPVLPRVPFAAMAGGAMLLSTHTPEAGHTPEFGPAMPLAGHFAKPRMRAPHKSDISALIWTKEGLLSASWDKTVRLWNLRDNSPDKVVLQNPQPIFAIAYSPQHSLLAVVGDSRDEPSIRIWDCVQHKETGLLRGHTKTVSAVAFDPAGKLLASAAHDGTVRIWDPLTGQERCLLRGHATDVRSVAFASGHWAIASGGEHSVRVWSLGGQREDKFELEANAPLRGIAMSADNRWLAQVDRDGNTKVWRVTFSPHAPFIRELAYTLKGALGSNLILAISPNGRYVAAASTIQEDWQVRIWTLPPSDGKRPLEVKESRSWKSPGKIQTLAIHDHWMVTGGSGGLQIWDLTARQMIKQLIPAIDERYAMSATFTPDGTHLFASHGKRVQVWNTANWKLVGGTVAVAHLESREGIQMLGLGMNEQAEMTLATVDEMGFVWLWDVARKARGEVAAENSAIGDDVILEKRCQLSGHMEAVTSLHFTPDGKTLATTSEDRTVRLWDTVTGQERATLTGHTDSVSLCRFYNSGTGLLTVGREGHVRMWHGPIPDKMTR
jgi:WD40 repeat protein/serine/threonine protein kinase